MHFLDSVTRLLLLSVLTTVIVGCKNSPSSNDSFSIDSINSGPTSNVEASTNGNQVEPSLGSLYLGKYHLFPREASGWDEGGWSVLTPSQDSRLIYVSSSSGDDVTAEFVEESSGRDIYDPGPIKPYKTIEAALGQAREGYPDWVLLKRGDIWNVSNIISVRAGRSVFERSVITSYGSSKERPLINTQASNGFRVWIDVDFVAIIDLSLYAAHRDPSSSAFAGWGLVGNPSGIYMYQPEAGVKKSILIENNDINFFGTGMVMTGAGHFEDVVIRRNIIRNSYSEQSHAQGFYANHASVLLEENIFDHNGWYKKQIDSGNDQAEGQATFFNHNTYFADSFDTRFVNNIFLRSSSIQNKWASNSEKDAGMDSIRSENLWIEGNVYVEGEVGISAGGNTDYDTGSRWENMTIQDNVMLAIGRSQPTNRNLGWYIEVDDWKVGSICGNYLLNNDNPNVDNLYGVSVTGHSSNVAISRNTIHGLIRKTPGIHSAAIKLDSVGDGNTWVQQNNIQLDDSQMRVFVSSNESSVSFDSNQYYSDADPTLWFRVDGADHDFTSWKDLMVDVNSNVIKDNFDQPKRSFESYLALIGASASIDTFMELVVRQSKSNWRQDLTAQSISDYIRSGYGGQKCE